VSATSWFTGGPHLRVYSEEGGKLIERCWDDNGPWYTGAYRGEGKTVGSTSWLDRNGQIHIRVYSGNAGKITEQCWDKDKWYTGAFVANGDGASATSWLDGGGTLHIRVYVNANGTVTEKCWDGSGPWYDGAYRET
jgi:hypothetical protein